MKTLLSALALVTFVTGDARDASARGGGACASIADAVLEACRSEAADDFWIAVARCRNLPAKDAARSCRTAAREVAREARGECAEQRGGRLDVCDALGDAPYRPAIDPANFVSQIDNPFLPLLPGTVFVLESPSERVELTVTHQTTTILGVVCTVVRDLVTQNGGAVEDTLDYFAQDRAGNVWYFGEESKDFDAGELVSLDGSWKAGRDDAQPGIIMPAAPAIGTVYRQEYAVGEAEDLAEVTSLTDTVTVRYGAFTNVLRTDEFTPTEPGVVGQKFYAAGVGLVLDVSADGERLELVSVTSP